MDGKRVGRPSVMAAAAGFSQKRLFFIRDCLSGLFFLVDTGAEVSIFPASNIDRRSGRTGPTLRAVNGSSINTFGVRTVLSASTLNVLNGISLSLTLHNRYLVPISFVIMAS